MDTTYPRPPIDGSSIRLFKLKARADNGSFKAELETVAFETGSKKAIEFNAASYTWGEGRKSSSINIEFDQPSSKLPVLERLVPYLNMIWENKDLKKKRWWIDFICINQQDNKEKASQLEKMAEIYTKAKHVAIWLGEENDTEWKIQDGKEIKVKSDCTGAIAFLKSLAEARAKARGWKKKKKFAQEWSQSKYNGQWAAVVQLFGRNWWTRWWTLQEVLLPERATFYVGKEYITREALNVAIYATWLCGNSSESVIQHRQFEAAWNRRRLLQWWRHSQRNGKIDEESYYVLERDTKERCIEERDIGENDIEERTTGLSLLATLSYLGSHDATDPKDRLFACLGLLDQKGRGAIPEREPHDGKSVQLLYTDLVERFSKIYGNLDIICFSHIFNCYNISHKPKEYVVLPSWVPDWRAQVRSSPVPLMASQTTKEHNGNCRPPRKKGGDLKYDAPGKYLRGKSNVEFSRSEDDNTRHVYLTENGVILDFIDGLASLRGIETRCKSEVCTEAEVKHAAIPSKSVATTTKDSALHLLENICRSLVLDRKDKYLTDRAPPQFVSQFLFLCYACLRNDEGSDPIFRTWFDPDPVYKAWFQENKTLRLGDQSLESLVRAIVDSEDKNLFSSLPHFSLQTGLPTTFDSGLDSEEAPEGFLQRFHDTVRKMSRRLMVTDRGYIGMAPCRAQQGDAVVILSSCRIPLILRKVEAQDAWKVIGEAYIDGWMNGEVQNLIVSGKRKVEPIKLM